MLWLEWWRNQGYWDCCCPYNSHKKLHQAFCSTSTLTTGELLCWNPKLSLKLIRQTRTPRYLSFPKSGGSTWATTASHFHPSSHIEMRWRLLQLHMKGRKGLQKLSSHDWTRACSLFSLIERARLSQKRKRLWANRRCWRSSARFWLSCS